MNMTIWEEIKATIASYWEKLITLDECIECLLAIPSRVCDDFKDFVKMTNWSDLDCLAMIASAHPDFVPYGTYWTPLPYSLYIKWWALRVCWLNGTTNTMYAWDVYLKMNYWEYNYSN